MGTERGRLRGDGDPPPWRIRAVDETGSTNDDLLAELRAGDPRAAEGAVLVAGRQLAGRGRRGREWSCPAGEGLLVSLRLDCGLDGLPSLGPLAVLAAIEVLEAGAPVGCDWTPAWKWPNDLLLVSDGEVRKLAGLLIQTRIQGARVEAVIGLGLNLAQREFPEGLRWPPISLAQAGWTTDADGWLAAWLERLEARRSLLGKPQQLLERLSGRDWLARATLVWRTEAADKPVEAVSHGRDGRLGLRVDGRWNWLADGEVEWTRSPAGLVGRLVGGKE